MVVHSTADIISSVLCACSVLSSFNQTTPTVQLLSACTTRPRVGIVMRTECSLYWRSFAARRMDLFRKYINVGCNHHGNLDAAVAAAVIHTANSRPSIIGVALVSSRFCFPRTQLYNYQPLKGRLSLSRYVSQFTPFDFST